MGVDKVIILPGNGCGDIEECNWYKWMAEKLRAHFGDKIAVEMRSMPDPGTARREIWLPFVKDVLGATERSIVLGHSSGAVAAMRLAEEEQLYGLILVGACHTDLGCPNERASNYYPQGAENAWKFDTQVANTTFISVFASASDPYIPIEEQRFVGENLCKQTQNGSKYMEYPAEEDRGHWMESAEPDILKYTIKMVEKGL